MLRKRLIPRLLAPLILLFIVGVWSTHQTESSAMPLPLSIQDQPACSHVGVIAVDPPSKADLNLQARSSVTFKINVTNSCPITAYAIALQYDPSVLKWQSIDQPL